MPAYIVPFLLFLLLTAAESYLPVGTALFYPIKIVVVGLALFIYRRHYTEIQHRFSYLSLFAGLLVFVIWILPEGRYPTIGGLTQWDPHQLDPYRAVLWIAFRLLGASIVVPIIEELFWRSFLLRYLISIDFKKVSLGTFTWLSFGVTVILFGVEHQRWFVGILAGVIYTLLLYRTKNLSDCIIAHAVTNFALGVYVIVTHQWSYW